MGACTGCAGVCIGFIFGAVTGDRHRARTAARGWPEQHDRLQ